MSLENLYPVIVAGGSGTRFWPASRKAMPKQFLPFADDGRSLIQLTAERLNGLVTQDNIAVVTGGAYKELTKEHLPQAKIVIEPAAKNTAAAIALAVSHVARINSEGVMLTLWSDAAISNDAEFQRVIKLAYSQITQEKGIALIGVTPDCAHTGYGYIQASSEVSPGVSQVAQFCEKPSYTKAEEYLAAGNFYWNPGIFIWHVESIISAFKEYLPDIYSWIQKLINSSVADYDQTVQDFFNQVESVSIDNALLEKCLDLKVVPANGLGWSDVGSWDEWANFQHSDVEKNQIIGNAVCINAKNNLVKIPKNKFGGIHSVNNLIIVDTQDALLVCDKNNAQGVKEIVEYLKSKGQNFI